MLQRAKTSIINITLTFHQQRLRCLITQTLIFKSHYGFPLSFLLIMTFGVLCHLLVYSPSLSPSLFILFSICIFCFPLPLISMSSYLLFFHHFCSSFFFLVLLICSSSQVKSSNPYLAQFSEPADIILKITQNEDRLNAYTFANLFLLPECMHDHFHVYVSYACCVTNSKNIKRRI